MFILDSDIVTLLHANHPAVIRHLETTTDEVALSVITVIEVMRGRFEFLMKASSKEQFLHAQRLMRFSAEQLETLPTVFLDERALDLFEAIQKQKGLKKIGRADLLIASIAMAHNATLITRNLKHFKLIPRLKCENWVD